MWREQVLPGDDNATLCASLEAKCCSEFEETAWNYRGSPRLSCLVIFFFFCLIHRKDPSIIKKK